LGAKVVAVTVVGGAAVVAGAVVGGTVVGGTVVGATVGGVVVGASVVAGAEVEVVDDVELVDEVLDVAGLFEWLLRPIRKAPTATMMATTTMMPMTRARSTGSRPSVRPVPAASGSTDTCEPAAAAGAGT
jgi:hypothetical protein